MRYSLYLFISLFIAFCATFIGGQKVSAQRKKTEEPSLSVETQRAFDYLFLQALALKEQEQYDGAFEYFRQCLSLVPNSPVVLFEISNYYQYLGLKTEALEMMKLAVEEEPGNFWYNQSLANAYEKNSQKDEAIAVYEQMASNPHSRSEVLILLLELYLQNNNFDKAIQVLADLEKREGRSEQLSMQKYRVFMLMGDNTGALREIESLSAEYPNELRFIVLTGDIYLQQGEKEKAYKTYSDVLARDPDNVAAQLSLIGYYQAESVDSLFNNEIEKLLLNPKLNEEMRLEFLQKIVAEAEQNKRDENAVYKLFDKVLALAGDQVAAATLYIQYMMMKKEADEKIVPILEKILQMEPENVPAQMQLLRYAIARRDFKDIIAKCDTAMQYNPQMIELYYYQGISYFQQKQPHKAIEIFTKGLQRRDSEASDILISDMYGLIGDTQHELGNLKACLEAYDSALVYNQDNISILNNYAYYLSLQRRDLEEAEEMSLRTIKAEPENPIYLDTYAWILFQQKRYEEAKIYAEKLLSLNNEKSMVEYMHIGDIFAQCGDIDKAILYWQKAKELGPSSKKLEQKIKKRKYIPDDKK